MSAPDKPIVMIVDDEADLRSGLGRVLRASGFEAVEAADAEEAERAWSARPPDVAIVDQGLPGRSGIELLTRLRERSPSVPVVMLTAHGSIDLAVDAVKRGAEHFLTKPVDSRALLLILERALANRRNRLTALSVPRPAHGVLEPFVGESPVIRRLAEEAGRVAATDRPVLITGETGTGKGVLARWLHARSARGAEAFVDVNCAGLSRELLESELFGFEAGAFTGAARRKVGLLEEAHRGTVFLDELADMDAAVQGKLLKVLEERRLRRLGDTRERTVDIRLVAATHRDLPSLMREGRFREDLYYRLSTFPLRVPPLRERSGDVVALSAALLGGFAAEIGRPGLHLLPDAQERLRSCSWRGNIRELRNVLERAALFARADAIAADEIHLADDGPTATGGQDLGLTLDAVERRHVLAVFGSEGNRVQPAARRLGISRSALYERLRRYGALPDDRERTAGDGSQED